MKTLYVMMLAGVMASWHGEAAAESLLRKLQPSRDAHSIKDTVFNMQSCEITADRTAVCTINVENRYRDKSIVVARGISIQDDSGNDYPVTAGGFGTDTARPKWDQIAVADSTYQLTVIAPNISSRATSVRAVVFPRLYVQTPQGQTLGYLDQVVFSKPTMVSHEAHAETPETPAETTEAAPAPKVQPQPRQKPQIQAKAEPNSNTAKEEDFPSGDMWIVVGFWDYDAVDGQQLPANGLVMRNVPGGNLGVQWSSHLELKNHAALAPRARTLWPVSINPGQRKICANYPDYPTYDANVDLPGSAADGTYHVSNCNGG